MIAKRSVGVTIFAWLLIIIGSLTTISFSIYFYFSYVSLNEGNFFTSRFISDLFARSLLFHYLSLWKYSYYLLPTALIFYSLMLLISGIGLLRLKLWARYFIITFVLVFFLILPVPGLIWIWGWRTYGMNILIQIIIALSVLIFFMIKGVKAQFERDIFTFKSRYGLAIIVIIILGIIPISSTMAFKAYSLIRHQDGKLPLIEFKEGNDSNSYDKSRSIELLGMSFLIPKQCYIRSIFYDLKHCSIVITGFNGYMLLDNSEIEEFTIDPNRKRADSCEYEQEFWTNTWNPFIAFQRKLYSPVGKNIQLKSIASTKVRGFIRSGDMGNNLLIQAHLYANDFSVSRNVIIVAKNEGLDKDRVYNILYSFDFIKEQKKAAGEYYKKGAEALKSKDYIEAQFKFAQAYYLSSDNPEYGFLLAKTLGINGEQSYESCVFILERTLKINPEYKEAKELLETLKQKIIKYKKPK